MDGGSLPMGGHHCVLLVSGRQTGLQIASTSNPRRWPRGCADGGNVPLLKVVVSGTVVIPAVVGRAKPPASATSREAIISPLMKAGRRIDEILCLGTR